MPFVTHRGAKIDPEAKGEVTRMLLARGHLYSSRTRYSLRRMLPQTRAYACIIDARGNR
jgi:hypothetical protein